MIWCAARAGGLVAAGLAVLGFELTRRQPPPGTPPRPAPIKLTETGTKRLVFALAAGLAMLAVTRWPVAALAAGLGVAFVPVLTSTRRARQRTPPPPGPAHPTPRGSHQPTRRPGLETAPEHRVPPPATADPP